MRSLLTSPVGYGFLGFPNFMRRNKRLLIPPRSGKSLVRISAVEEAAISSGLLSHIGRVATSSIREDWRLHEGRGELFPAFFVFPKLHEALMFHIYTTSRTTRVLHRFTSFLNQPLAVVLFGLLLAFSLAPELFLAGGAE